MIQVRSLVLVLDEQGQQGFTSNAIRTYCLLFIVANEGVQMAMLVKGLLDLCDHSSDAIETWYRMH